MELQTLIEDRLRVIEAETAELKTKKEIVDDAIENDSGLVEMKADIKALQADYKKRKDEIMADEGMQEVIASMKQLRDDKKMLQELLSGDLLGYYKQHNTFEFKDSKGNFFHYTFSSKVKKTNQPELPLDMEEA